VLFALGVSQTASAQTAPNGNLFNCNVIYYGNTTSSGIYAFDPTKTPLTGNLITWSPSQGNATTNPTFLPGATGNTTMALGPSLDENGNIIYKDDGEPQLTMYHWGWNWTNSGLNGAGRIKYLDDKPGAKWQYLPTAANAMAEGNTDWSGGEVDQITGELYLAGGLTSGTAGPNCPSGVGNQTALTARIGCNFRLGILNPATGAWRHSGQMQPASPSDAALVANYWPASDMAIDAQGNAYVIAGNSASNPWYLVRMVPQATTGGWKYNVVAQLNNTNVTTGALRNWPGSPNTFYSMNFLNGKLYTAQNSASVYVCDPLGGICQVFGDPTSGTYRDFAACQVAPVITGRVYNDTSGKGNVIPDVTDGVEGVTVSIYEDNGSGPIYKGSQTTSGAGDYSFIVDSTNAIFYIRLEQPQINGVNAQQTWASAGGDVNESAAFCLDENNPTAPARWISSSLGPVQDYFTCSGARLFGADPAGPKTPGTPWDITQAQTYSRVVMTNDREVAYADFGISAMPSYGDASSKNLSGGNSNFVSLFDNGGPVHNLALNRMWLGATAPNTLPLQTDGVDDPNSAAHTTDDGVFISVGGINVPLQNAVLAAGRTDYKMTVKLSGQDSSKGYLSIWDNATAGYVVTPKFADLQDTTSSGQIQVSYPTLNAASAGIPLTYITRVRFSSTPGLPAQTTTQGGGQQATGSTSTTMPWALDGEVEDYQTYQAAAIVRVATISLGNTGTFNYTFSGEIFTTPPSTPNGSVTTTAVGVQTNEAPGALHATSNYTSPQAMTITQTMPAPDPTNWTFVSVACSDSVTGVAVANLTIDNTTGKVTIPGSALGVGADVICVYTNRHSSLDPAQSTFNVTPAGPLYTNSTYTASVTARDSAGAIVPDGIVDLTVTGGTLAATSTGTFDSATGQCTADGSGVCNVTWTSASAGSFTINAKTAAGDPITGGQGSPQTRVFVAPATGHSTLTADKTSLIANHDSATLTVTLRDANNQPTTSVGTTEVDFTSSGPAGSWSTTSCTVPNGGSSCNVTISSTTMGATTVGATVNGEATTPPSVTLTFTYDSVIDWTRSTLTATPPELLTNDPNTSQVTMTLRDAYGNLYGTATAITFTAPTAGEGSLSPLTCTTATSTGACSVTYTPPAALPAGAVNDEYPVTVSANITGVANAKTTTITLTDSGAREIKITKTVVQPSGGGYIAGGQFDITVKCGSAASETLHLASGDTQSVFGNVGDTCTITEAPPASGAGGAIMGGYTNTATYPSTIVLTANTAARAIEVVNTITLTSGTGAINTLSVYKSVTGATQYDTPDALFTINVTCVGDANVKAVTLKKNEIGHVDVATGAKCTISEPAPLPATTNAAWKYDPIFRPSTTTVSADKAAYVENHITDTGTFAVNVTNTVSGQTTAAGYTTGGAFTVTLNCGASYTFTDSMPEGDTYTYKVPNNTPCSLATTTWPTLPVSNFAWVDTDNLVSPVTGDQDVTVNHEVKANTEAAYSTLQVTPAGPVGDSTHYATNNAYTITVTANDSTPTPQPNQPIVITVSSGTLSGGANFTPTTAMSGTCMTDNTGVCSVTWTSANAGKDFTVSATMGGVEIGSSLVAPQPQNPTNCNSTVASCSPQSRTFYGTVDCSHSTVTAVPVAVNADGSSTSEVTVTVVDANGTPVLAQIPVPLSLTSSSYGTLSASSCTTSATTGACAVTYTSPAAIPPGSGSIATVTAKLPCGDKTVDIGLDNSTHQTITVKKTVSGAGATGQPFAITVNCGAGYTQTFNLADGQTDSMIAPVGVTCNVSEANPAGTAISSGYTNMATIAPSQFTILGGSDETVEVTNTIASGPVTKETMTVSKVIAGDGNNATLGHIPTNEFSITIACTGTVPKTSTFVLKAGQSAIVEASHGDQCSVKEGAEPAARTGFKYVPNFDPLVIASLDRARSVTVTNRLVDDDGTPYYQVTLSNAVVGDQSLYNSSSTFTLEIHCGTFHETPALSVGDVAGYSVAGGATASCTVATTAWPQLLDPSYVWFKDTYNPVSPFAVTGNVNEVVTHELDNIKTRTITVSKTVSGPGAATGYVSNGKFAINVQCGSAASKQLLLADGATDSTVTAQVGDICTVSEANPSTSVVASNYTNTALIYPSRFEVSDDTTVNVINRIENGTFPTKTVTVTKNVIDTYNVAAQTDTFEINVNCANTTAAVFELQDGWTGTVQGQAGASCTISEPTTPAPSNASYKYVAMVINPASTTLPSAASSRTGIDATVTNVVVPYSDTFYPITLNNVVTNNPSPSAYNVDEPFVLSMNCGSTSYSWPDITMYGVDTAQYQAPMGSSCTMGTVDRPTITNVNHKWDNTTGTVYNPASPFPVNAAVNETATHNIIPTGMRDITITKKVTGDTTGAAVGVNFTIHVNCGNGDQPFQLADNGSQVVQALDNSTCTITEDAGTSVGANNSYTALIYPSKFVVTDDTNVTVENRIETGKPNLNKANVTVTKTVIDTLGGDVAGKLFTIEVNCNNTTLASFQLQKGWSASVEGEIGQSCTTEETVIPTAASASYTYAPSIVNATATLSSSGLLVSVYNIVVGSTTTMHSVGLTNLVTGDQPTSVYNNAQPFVLSFNCGTGTSYNFGQVSMAQGSVSLFSVPNGNTCAMNTTSLPMITNPLYNWFSDTYTPAASFSVMTDQLAVVTHALRPVGQSNITVTKVVQNATALATPASFTIHLNCGPGYVKDMILADGGSDNLWVPSGSSCTVTEDNPALAAGYNNTAVIAPSGFTANADTTVTVTNRIATGTFPDGTGTLYVTKTISGYMAAHNPAASFGIEVNCATTPLASFDLLENQTASVQGEVGQICSVSEPTIPATLAPATYRYVANIWPSKTTLQATQLVSVQNEVVTGPYSALTLTNAVTNDQTPSLYDPAGNFTLALVCGSSNWTPSMHTGDEGIFNVPTGTQCSLTTTAWPTIDPNYEWFMDTYAPSMPPFTVSASFTETATHDIQKANSQIITVHKAVSGAGYVTGQTFAITVDCGNGNSKVMNLINGGSDTIVAQIGSTCNVSEADPGSGVIGANNTNMATIAPSLFNVMKGVNQTVEVQNQISSGTTAKTTLLVSKTIAGDTDAIDAGDNPLTEFSITVNCGTAATTKTFQVKSNQTASVEVPVGATCTTTEPQTAADPGYIYVANITPSTTTVPATGGAVNVENVVMPDTTVVRSVSVTNVVTGDSTPSRYNNSSTFGLELACGSFRREPTMRVGDIATYNVVIGSSCTVSTISRAAILDTTLYSWGTDTYSPTNPFPVNAAVTEVATHPLELTKMRTITVTKTVVDGAGAYTTGEFNVTLNCGTGYTKAMTLNGSTANTDSLVVPVGNVCSVRETVPAASVIGGSNRTNFATIYPSDFTVSGDTAVSVSNRIETGTQTTATLKVTKEVTGANKSAGDVPNSVFGITVACPGLPDSSIELQDGWSATVQGVLGAQCTVTEPTIPSAKAGYQYAPNNTGTVTLQADSGVTPGTSMIIENLVAPSNVNFDLVSMTNAVTGDTTPTSAYNHAEPFVLEMDCPANTDYSWTITGSVGDKRYYSVPRGSTCTMSTTQRPAMTDSGYKWNNTIGTVYTPMGSPFLVNGAMDETATHNIVPAVLRDITITKAVTNGTGSQLTTPFTIHVDCGSGVQTFTLANGGSHVVQALDNRVCTVTEDSTTSVGADGYTAMIVPSQFTVDGNQTVTVTNRIESGKANIQPHKAWINVTKQLNGAVSQSDPNTLFEVEVDCDNTTEAIFMMKAGWNASVEAEVGQSCAIYELNLPTLSGGYAYAPSIQPSTSNALPSTGLNVTVTNTVTTDQTYQVVLTNAVSGDQTPSVYNNAQPFVTTFNCGTGSVYDFGQVSMLAYDTSTYSVKSGNTCNVGIVNKPTITNTNYKWNGETYNPSASFAVSDNTMETVTHALATSQTRKITVTKTVIDAAGGYHGGLFDITVTCGSDVMPMQLASGGSMSVYATDGTDCYVEESDPAASVIGTGNSNTYVIAPSGFTVSGHDVNVNITNRIGAGTFPNGTGTLYVTKSIGGNTAAHDPANVFGIEVDCASTPVANFDLLENQTATVQGELGQQCTISEPTIPSAAGAYRYVPNISPKKTTLQATQLVSVQNAVVTGTYYEVTLTNAVTGDQTPSVYDHTGNFSLTLNCGTPATTWTPDMHTGDESGFWVPASSSCQVSTTDYPNIHPDYTWFSDTYSPTSPFTVNGTMTETATHDIQPAAMRTITVSKTVTGGTSSSAFSIHVVCTEGGMTITNATLSLANGQSDKAYAPDGAVCTVTEDNNATAAGAGNSYTALIYPAGFTINGADQAVAVENRIETGKPSLTKATLKVSKVVGEVVAGYKAAGHDPNALFTITADCTNTTNASFKLMDGQYATVEGEVGQTCVIDEPTEPSARTSYQYVPSIVLNSLTLMSTGNAVTVNNDVASSGTTYHRVYLVNDVVGSHPTQYDQSAGFVLTLTCGSVFAETTPSMPALASAFYSVPDNTNCNVETNSHPNANTGYAWYGETLDLSAPFSTSALPFRTQPMDETIKVHHDLEAAGTVAVTIDSSLTGDSSLYQNGDIEVTITCGTPPNETSQTVTLPPNGNQVVWVPQGEVCTVVEDISAVAVNNGTTRRTIVPSRFKTPTTPGGAITVGVENEILQGPVSLADLTVDKIVTEQAAGYMAASGYDAATTMFSITVQSTSQAAKTQQILGNQSFLVDFPVGDAVDITEAAASLPALNFGYMYAPTISPSHIASMSAAARTAYVTNMIAVTGTTYQVTFGQAAVNNTAGSGYVSGSGVPLETTVTCGNIGYFLPLAEGDTTTATVPGGAACTTAVANTLPPLNSGYYWNGPTTNPTFSAGSPFVVSANGTITIAYGAGLRNPPSNNEPIPTLDPKALLLLIGLLTGVAFWRSRRQRQN